jgi:flagellar M-ring protein FliF
VQYKLEDNGNTILVDKSQLYDTRIQLAGEGLPSESIVGYELFDKTNLG